LATTEVELALDDVRRETKVTPGRARTITEILDATSELPPQTVTVHGFLQGAKIRRRRRLRAGHRSRP
jgi:hypothetical protein